MWTIWIVCGVSVLLVSVLVYLLVSTSLKLKNERNLRKQMFDKIVQLSDLINRTVGDVIDSVEDESKHLNSIAQNLETLVNLSSEFVSEENGEVKSLVKKLVVISTNLAVSLNKRDLKNALIEAEKLKFESMELKRSKSQRGENFVAELNSIVENIVKSMSEIQKIQKDVVDTVSSVLSSFKLEG